MFKNYNNNIFIICQKYIKHAITIVKNIKIIQFIYAKYHKFNNENYQ